MTEFLQNNRSIAMVRHGLVRFVTGVTLLGTGIFVGASLAPPGATLAQPQQQHFQSGDQLALPILKEIAATLVQMDARISRIETIAQQWRPPKTNATPQR